MGILEIAAGAFIARHFGRASDHLLPRTSRARAHANEKPHDLDHHVHHSRPLLFLANANPCQKNQGGGGAGVGGGELSGMVRTGP